MTTATAAAPESRPLDAIHLRIDMLDPSATNPRKKFNQARLEELAASMAPPVGILEPLVVRPKPAGRYEIIAGERRFRAAKIAGLADVPVVIRNVTDAQVITLQLVENKNREDIHPLDEARAIEKLLKLSPRDTPKSIASTIGMSERYVQNRLHYVKLAPAVQDAFEKDRITPGHADLIVRLKPEDQARALKACFSERFDYGDGGTDAVDVEVDGEARRVEELVSVRELDRWIKGSVRLEVAPKSRELDFYPDVQAAIAPKSTIVEGGVIEKAPAPTLLQVTDSYEYWGKDKPGPLTRNLWEPIEKKKCALAQRAVIVLGKGRGEVLDVCVRDSGCKVHFPPATKAPAVDKDRKPSKYELQEKARQARIRLWGQVKKRALEVVRQKAPDKLTPAALAVLSYGIERWHYNGKPRTLAQLIIKCAEDAAFSNEATFTSRIAKPLGINLKPLFKPAAPPKKATLEKVRNHLRKQLKAHAAPTSTKKRKAGKKR